MTNNSSIREEIKDYFNALGMAEPWDYDRCVEEYTNAIVKLITIHTDQILDSIISELPKNQYPSYLKPVTRKNYTGTLETMSEGFEKDHQSSWNGGHNQAIKEVKETIKLYRGKV